MTVGILALQGNFSKHLEKLHALDCTALLVKYPEQLQEVDGLVLPGGESTCITLLMEKTGFHSAISEFAKEKPVFGTCAGLILMASEPNDERVNSLHLLDISVNRNGYGRQVHSGIHEIEALVNGRASTLQAMFIRAPKITKTGNNVSVLGKLNNDPVLVQQGHHLAACFHPEMSVDISIYSHFLEMISSKNLAHAV